MHRKLVIHFFVLASLAGCATYHATPLMTPDPASLPATVQQAGIVVGADPYVEPERQKTMFDADLASAGVLPVLILVRNQGPHTLMIRRTGIVLLTPDTGKVILKRGSWAAGLFTPPAPRMGYTGTCPYGGCLPFVAVAIGESMSHMSARADRYADYRAKEFKDVRLKPGASAHGFLYFLSGSVPEATLRLSVIDIDDSKRLNIDLPFEVLKKK